MSSWPGKPVIIIVTGAWHVPEHYSALSSRLRHQGFTVECPSLPTNNNANPPDKTLDDDIAQIRQLALQHLEDGSDIVVLMHSYGGMVGTFAFSGLGAADRIDQTCVKALIYMCSFVPFEGESLAGIFGGGLPPFLTTNNEGFIEITNPSYQFYHDLPEDERAKWTSRLVQHPTSAQFEAPKVQQLPAAWRRIPMQYLVCKNDKSMLLAVQEMMIDRVEKADPALKVHREYCDGSHAPFLGMPDRVVDVVVAACR